MDFNNNPSIKPINENGQSNKTQTPKPDGFNPIKSLTDRVNDLEKDIESYNESFDTKHIETETLDVLNGGDVKINNLKVEDTLCNSNLMNLSPIESQNVVGYDEEGNLIPIHAIYDTGTPIYTPQNAQFLGTDADRRFLNRVFFDYIVDSQSKFDDLMTLAKSVGGVTYKNIAIVGGNGDGLYGEYEYMVESDTTDTQFNNANFYSYLSPKININFSDVNAENIKVFNGVGKFENIEIALSGTIVGNTDITLFADSYIKNFTFTNEDDIENIIFDNCKLENVINTNYTTFNKCILKDCDTVQSYFISCTSDMLYVSTSNTIAEKFKFEDCSIHLNIRPSDETVTVNMNIESLTSTTLSCLDKKSTMKILNIYVDECDLFSKIIGNNDAPNKITNKRFTDIDVEVSPADLANAYLSINDTSKTPIYTTDTTITSNTDFYLDTSYDETKELTFGYGETASGEERMCYKIYNDNTAYFDLSFKSIFNYYAFGSDTFKVIKLLKNKADKTFYNETEVKMYIDRGEPTGTILYSKDNGSTVYIDSDCTNKVRKVFGTWVSDTTYMGYAYRYYHEGSTYGTIYLDLSLSRETYGSGHFEYTDFSLLEVQLKDPNDYAVQVTSTNGDYINVKDAYFIQKF